MSYCDWDTTDELCLRYHDEEWGVPLHDDRGQFEFLSLEVMQCGLNWTMILHKREVFRACFASFDFDAVAAFGPDDVERILETPGVIRSRRKVEAIIGNAHCFQRVCEGSLSNDQASVSGEWCLAVERLRLLCCSQGALVGTC